MNELQTETSYTGDSIKDVAAFAADTAAELAMRTEPAPLHATAA